MRALSSFIGAEEAAIVRRVLFALHLLFLLWGAYAIAFAPTWAQPFAALLGLLVTGAWLVLLFGQEYQRKLAEDHRAAQRADAQLKVANITKATVPARVAQLQPTTITPDGDPL